MEKHFMKKQLISLLTFFIIAVVIMVGINTGVTQAASEYYRVVVFSDLHLPYKPQLHDKSSRQEQVMAAKNSLREQVNSWDDVNLIVAVGDITGGFGTVSEYAYALDYFSRLRHPYAVVTGNHDFMYADGSNISAKNFLRTIL